MVVVIVIVMVMVVVVVVVVMIVGTNLALFQLLQPSLKLHHIMVHLRLLRGLHLFLHDFHLVVVTTIVARVVVWMAL